VAVTAHGAARVRGDRSVELLLRAGGLLAEAAAAREPDERFVTAHLAALRAAAAVLAFRGRPPGRRGAARSLSAWVLLPQVAPELADWARLFAEAAPRRAAVETGRTGAVTAAQAERHRRDAGAFVHEVAVLLGAPVQQQLPQVAS
jgi:hypothetical protein